MYDVIISCTAVGPLQNAVFWKKTILMKNPHATEGVIWRMLYLTVSDMRHDSMWLIYDRLRYVLLGLRVDVYI